MSKMKIGTPTDSILRAVNQDEEQAIRTLAEIGFDAMDYSMFVHPIKGSIFETEDFPAYCRRLKETADRSGIIFGQVHAHYPSYANDPARDKHVFQLLAKSIQVTKLLGSEYVVIHPAIPKQCRYDLYQEETKELNYKMYKALQPYAEEYGVKIAIENMFSRDPETKKICPTVCSTGEQLLEYISMLDSDRFVTCLDTGHANLVGGSAEEMAYTLGDTLKVLHVHDNDGREDLHTAPYLHTIKWEKFQKALQDIGYHGVFSFEAETFTHQFPDALAVDSLKMLLKIGHFLTEGLSVEEEPGERS